MLILGIIVLASVLASFTDWLFMDVLVHRYYRAAPDIWRPSGGPGRIVASQLIGTASTAAAVMLCLLAPGRPLLLSVAVWCAGPLPVIGQNLQWIKMQPQIAASHAAGWLVRILIAAEAARWLAPG
jgi:hypothetical protein